MWTYFFSNLSSFVACPVTSRTSNSLTERKPHPFAISTLLSSSPIIRGLSLSTTDILSISRLPIAAASRVHQLGKEGFGGWSWGERAGNNTQNPSRGQ